MHDVDQNQTLMQGSTAIPAHHISTHSIGVMSHLSSHQDIYSFTTPDSWQQKDTYTMGGDAQGAFNMGGDAQGAYNMGGDTQVACHIGGDAQSTYSMDEDTQSIFSMGGYAQGAYNIGGYAQGVYTTGGDAQGAFNMGGDAQGAYNMGGDAQGAYKYNISEELQNIFTDGKIQIVCKDGDAQNSYMGGNMQGDYSMDGDNKKSNMYGDAQKTMCPFKDIGSFIDYEGSRCGHLSDDGRILTCNKEKLKHSRQTKMALRKLRNKEAARRSNLNKKLFRDKLEKKSVELTEEKLQLEQDIEELQKQLNHYQNVYSIMRHVCRAPKIFQTLMVH